MLPRLATCMSAVSLFSSKAFMFAPLSISIWIIFSSPVRWKKINYERYTLFNSLHRQSGQILHDKYLRIKTNKMYLHLEGLSKKMKM